MVPYNYLASGELGEGIVSLMILAGEDRRSQRETPLPAARPMRITNNDAKNRNPR